MIQPEKLLEQVNQLLEDKYCITLQDTGYEIEEWVHRFGNMSAAEAVEYFAEKYHLISREY